MKRIFLSALALIMCVALTSLCFVSCDNTPAETDVGTKAPGTNAPETNAPSTNAPETGAPGTSAPGTAAPVVTNDPNAMYEDEIPLYVARDNAGDHSAVSAADGTELGCKFNIPDGSLLTGVRLVSCPTWSTVGESGFTFELYKWSEDYDTTVAEAPIASQSYTEWADNSECFFDLYEALGDSFTGLESGNYLWVFRGDTANIGIWAMDCDENCQYFENGNESYTAGYECYAVILTH